MRQEIKQRLKNIQQGQMPEGYKQVFNKIIPKDWDYPELGEKIELISGQHINSQDYNTLGEGIPYLTGPSDFLDGVIKATKFTEKPKTVCEKGDILITVKGSGVGKTIIADNKYCISRQLMAIRCNENFRNVLYYHLKNNESEYNVDSVGLIPGITRTEIMKSRIPFARNNKESILIGKILSTWDKAIELKEQLIEQKKQQKRWLMQKLLTGEKRLPGFSDKWRYNKAGDIFTNVTDKSHRGIGIVLSSSQDKGIIPRDEIEIDIKYDKNSLSSYKKVNKGDFVISLRSFQGGIEYSEYEGLLSPAYTILRNKVEIDKSFYKHLFKSTDFITRLNGLIYGIRDGKQIGFKDFATLKLPSPNIEEQKVIGKLLDLAAQEIEIHQQELDLLKLQKKGLMQLLLTGIVRVQC